MRLSINVLGNVYIIPRVINIFKKINVNRFKFIEYSYFFFLNVHKSFQYNSIEYLTHTIFTKNIIEFNLNTPPS